MDPRSTPLKPFPRMRKKTLHTDLWKKILEKNIAIKNTYAPITWAPIVIEKKNTVEIICFPILL